MTDAEPDVDADEEVDVAPAGAAGVAAGKTVPLVRLALVLPAVVAGEDGETVHRLERLAASWGLAALLAAAAFFALTSRPTRRPGGGRAGT